MKDWLLPIVFVLILTSWLAGCDRLFTSGGLIEYERTGGFAGLDDHLIIQDDGSAALTRRSNTYEFTLDSQTLSRLEALFEEAQFTQLERQYLPDGGQQADLFEYVIIYKGHTVRTKDGAVPPSLQPILEALNEIVETQGSP